MLGPRADPEIQAVLLPTAGQARSHARERCGAAAATAGAAALAGLALLRGGGPAEPRRAQALGGLGDDPVWGCGLLGGIPGISREGAVAGETQRLIDGLRSSSSLGRVNYWNWNLAPDGATNLTKDFVFMPEQWGAAPVPDQLVRRAGEANFLDGSGRVSPAQMATLFLGFNEPDIVGSCLGDMFGTCVGSCTEGEACPAATRDAHAPPARANAAGHCNCWQFSMASGCGFWPLAGCAGAQPLPGLWSDLGCVQAVMANWRATATTAYRKGYKYLSTPLVAQDMGYARRFLEEACGCVGGSCACTDISCGCPVYIGFHFYGFDCRPGETGSYEDFAGKLKAVADVMDAYPFVKGAIINEVGMLNCDAPSSGTPICTPNNGKFPASATADGACPKNTELPNGLASFIERLFDLVLEAKTSDGRDVVKSFAWFNEDRTGGTYNLELFGKDGSVNEVGEAYIRGCKRWGMASREAGHVFDM